MKIVVLDGYTENPGDLSWSGFEGLGEFTVYDRGSETDKEGEAIARIGDAEIESGYWTAARLFVILAYWLPATMWWTIPTRLSRVSR